MSCHSSGQLLTAETRVQHQAIHERFVVDEAHWDRFLSPGTYHSMKAPLSRQYSEAGNMGQFSAAVLIYSALLNPK
jgi:hypothetical protein